MVMTNKMVAGPSHPGVSLPLLRVEPNIKEMSIKADWWSLVKNSSQNDTFYSYFSDFLSLKLSNFFCVSAHFGVRSFPLRQHLSTFETLPKLLMGGTNDAALANPPLSFAVFKSSRSWIKKRQPPELKTVVFL